MPDGRLARAREALALAVREQRNGGGAESHVVEAVRLMREEAHASALTPDVLLATMREAWSACDGAPEHEDGGRAVSEVVRLCVHEYFRQEQGR